MDRRKVVMIVASALAVFMLAGCSMVFEAGISGKVVTADGTETVPVADVSVFAYTDRSLRDSDFARFTRGEITRPSDGSGYVATTTTNRNGEFTVNKVVWETKKSEFGKTADVNRLYLIFYHEDYRPEKEDATVISGSTNSSNIYIRLEGNKDYTAVSVTVIDVATGRAMTAPATLEYSLEGRSGSDTITVTGNAAFTLSYEKGTNPDLTLSLTSPGSEWKMCDRDGNLTDNHSVGDISSGTLSVTLYMKCFELTLPAFSGNIDGSASSDVYNLNDNRQIRLAYIDKNGAEVFFPEVDESSAKTYSTRITAGDTIIYQHGLFSAVGNSDNYSIVINRTNYPDIVDWDNLTGKTLTLKLRLYFDSQYHEFEYSQRTDPALGHITLT